MTRALVFTVTLVATLGASPVWAQSSDWGAWGANGYVSLNGFYDIASRSSDLVTRPEINLEPATVTASPETGKKPLYDFTAGGRVRGNVGFGFGITFGTKTEDAPVRGSIPHPFYFNQPRTLVDSTSLERSDLMVHLAALWLVPVNDRFAVTAFGGPTWFQVKQETIRNLTLREAFPFETVAIDTVDRERLTRSRWGFNAGFDVSYYFSRYLGVQGLVRYSNGTVTITSTGTDSDLKVGGLHAGAGLRIRY